MKAARFYEKHKLIVEDTPIIEPQENEVLIRIHYCGVCGTDVHIYEGEKGSAEVNPPTTLGHEFSGHVVKAGSKVTKVKEGDKVVVDPNDYCKTCYFCNNGKVHLCRDMVGLGTARDGGFAEYITVAEHLVYPFSDDLSYEAASMVEPISCCLHGIKLAEIEPGDTVMVVGTGNIGLIMVQLAKKLGAAKVIAVEPSKIRREKAVTLGACFGIDPTADDTEHLLSLNHIENVDKVIDCARLVSTGEYSVKYAGKGATVMLFGLTGPDDVMQIKPFEMFRKELVIKSSFVNPLSVDKSIRLLEAGVLDVESTISDIVELADIASIFEKKLYKKDGKVLVKCF